VEIPYPIKALYGKPLIHKGVISKEEMWQSALELTERINTP
jgi:hypothetical protein